MSDKHIDLMTKFGMNPSLTVLVNSPTSASGWVVSRIQDCPLWEDHNIYFLVCAEHVDIALQWLNGAVIEYRTSVEPPAGEAWTTISPYQEGYTIDAHRAYRIKPEELLDASEEFHLNKKTDPTWAGGYTEEKLPFEVDAELEVKIGNPKYDVRILGKYGTGTCIVDVYRVLDAFRVTCPQLQHSIKKELNVGKRGHKDERQDLVDIVHSTQSALDMFDDEERYNE